MHVPDSLTDEVKKKFCQLIFDSFGSETINRILCAVLLTCPWYQATQNERGEQARHNVLFIVFVSHDHQFLAPVNQHVLDEDFVIDKGWLYAVELYPFSHFLTKGKSRCTEVLYCNDQAIVYSDDQWNRLRSELSYSKVTGLRGFVEACKGQAVSGIGKKGKDGKFRLKESTTFHQFCDSYRLQHHLYSTTQGIPLCVQVFDKESLPDIAKEGFHLLEQLYKDPDVSKRDIFDVLVKWRDSTVDSMKKFKHTDHTEVEAIVGRWQMDVRLNGRQLSVDRAIGDEFSNLTKLMSDIGGPVSTFQPEQILLVARAGSYLYGLSTPTSDIDYLIVYKEPTKNILSRCKDIKDNYESRGPTKELEYGAYEARLFCEMLLKGSIIILELVFADDLEYMSPSWKTLSANRARFVTEKAIQQYLGILRNNFAMLQNEKHIGTSRDRKLFYQIFHKEDCVRSLMDGHVPNVRCTGELKEFIMKVRTNPLVGEFSRDVLFKIVKDKIDNLLRDLAERPGRLKENMDYKLVNDWLLLGVRGITDSKS
ncbi:hypothetical protein FSP39_019882 [Pinctada imbricata]|uniref:Uncharacterized protein n=1 Tax=Pinctada imbricata TaxID=66713 RepID=A0AA88XTF7_PINIB|nr:hypothetical protein FSP39_019882 [Pinctada imbricata]